MNGARFGFVDPFPRGKRAMKADPLKPLDPLKLRSTLKTF
jgi:hypothetical protein